MNYIPFKHVDLPLLDALQPQDWPDIKPIFEWYVQCSYCMPIKIISNSTLIAVGAAILHQNVAWLGHIIVHPNFRNCGYGFLLTQQLIHYVKKQNIPSIYLIATDLGYPVYEKIGFVTEAEYLFYQNIKVQPPYPVSKNIFPYSSSYFHEIAAIDKAVSGEDRLPLLQENVWNSFVYLQQKKVVGCYLPQLREGSILAYTNQAGTDLMRLRLGTKTNACFPAENKAAVEYMQSLGYFPFKSAKRMYFGEKVPWQSKNIYNRISGNLG